MASYIPRVVTRIPAGDSGPAAASEAAVAAAPLAAPASPGSTVSPCGAMQVQLARIAPLILEGGGGGGGGGGEGVMMKPGEVSRNSNQGCDWLLQAEVPVLMWQSQFLPSPLFFLLLFLLLFLFLFLLFLLFPLFLFFLLPCITPRG